MAAEYEDLFNAIAKEFQTDKVDGEAFIRNSDFRELIDRIATDPTVVVDFTSFGKLDKAISDADADSNGKIDKKEFAVLMSTGFISAEELSRSVNRNHSSSDTEGEESDGVQDEDSEDTPSPSASRSQDGSPLPSPSKDSPSKESATAASPTSESNVAPSSPSKLDDLYKEDKIYVDHDPQLEIVMHDEMSDEKIPSWNPEAEKMQDILGEELYAAIIECFELLDLDSSGEISTNEAKCLMTGPASTGANLVLAFDKDGSGTLTLNELLVGSARLVSSGHLSDAILLDQILVLNQLLGEKREELGGDLEGAENSPSCCDRWILSLERPRLRKALRVLNFFSILLIIICIIIIFTDDDAHGWPAVVLIAVIMSIAALLLILEVRCDCCGIDYWFASHVAFLYVGVGRAWLYTFTGFLCIGCGPGALPLGIMVLLYGSISRYIIIKHPQCGAWFVTTDPEFLLAENKEIIQTADVLASEAALRVIQTLSPTAFAKFEQEMAPVKIFQTMLKMREDEQREAVEMAEMAKATNAREVKLVRNGARSRSSSKTPLKPYE